MRDWSIAGFSLIEVLVSLFILSLGVIGAASMQLTALRTSQQSGFQHVALQLATDIADQLRLSVANNLGDPSNPLLTLDFKNNGKAVTPVAPCYGAASNCDELALAAFGVYEVQSRVALLLPQGRVKVCRDGQPWDDDANSYRWSCSGGASKAPLVVKLGWRQPSTGMPDQAQAPAMPQLVLLVGS